MRTIPIISFEIIFVLKVNHGKGDYCRFSHNKDFHRSQRSICKLCLSVSTQKRCAKRSHSISKTYVPQQRRSRTFPELSAILGRVQIHTACEFSLAERRDALPIRSVFVQSESTGVIAQPKKSHDSSNLLDILRKHRHNDYYSLHLKTKQEANVTHRLSVQSQESGTEDEGFSNRKIQN